MSRAGLPLGWMGPIERDVPLPRSRRGDGSLRRQINALKVGDSFETTYTRDAAARYAKQIGITVATRSAKDGKSRVWRTK